MMWFPRESKTAEPGAAADGGGRIGIWDFKLSVAPAAAELGRYPIASVENDCRKMAANDSALLRAMRVRSIRE
jgi:hypothetical protein